MEPRFPNPELDFWVIVCVENKYRFGTKLGVLPISDKRFMIVLIWVAVTKYCSIEVREQNQEPQKSELTFGFARYRIK